MVGCCAEPHRVPQSSGEDAPRAHPAHGGSVPQTGGAHGRGDDQGGAVPLRPAGRAAARDHRELAGLQDEVRPEAFERHPPGDRGRVRRAAGAEVREFESGAAGLGLHRAGAPAPPVQRLRLRQPCPPVVVKVQRPDIEAIVETDLSALRVVGGWLKRYRPSGKRVNVPVLMEEFSRSTARGDRLPQRGQERRDLCRQLCRTTRRCACRVIWSHTTRRVLTLEDVAAIKITDYEAIEAAGDRPQRGGRPPAGHLPETDLRGPLLPRRPAPGQPVRPAGDRHRDEPRATGSWYSSILAWPGTLPEDLHRAARSC